MPLADLDAAAFWALVDRGAGPGGCWRWTGPTNSDGYGIVEIAGCAWRAHRVAWLLDGRELAEHLTLDHVCRTRACCNPWHLTPLSRAAHTRRGRARRRFDVLAPAPILDDHARRVASYLTEHGPTELNDLAVTLEIPINTLRKTHMSERLQARYGIRRSRHRRRVVFHAPSQAAAPC